MAYTMDYIDEVSDTDEFIEIDGIKLVIDPKAILFLLGTEMDYQKSTLNSGFILGFQGEGHLQQPSPDRHGDTDG